MFFRTQISVFPKFQTYSAYANQNIRICTSRFLMGMPIRCALQYSYARIRSLKPRENPNLSYKKHEAA